MYVSYTVALFSHARREHQIIFFKELFIYLYEYTVAVFRHTRRRHQILLQIVVSYHVIAGN